MNIKKAPSSNAECPDRKTNEVNVKSNPSIIDVCTALCLRIISKRYERFKNIQFWMHFSYTTMNMQKTKINNNKPNKKKNHKTKQQQKKPQKTLSQ